MRAFKFKGFAKWASDHGLTDAVLWAAVEEMERGLEGANLGGSVYKKRIALGGRGKRGGARTILVYRKGSRAFFVRGFAKNDRGNLGVKDLVAVKGLADDLLNSSDRELIERVESGMYIEVRGNGYNP